MTSTLAMPSRRRPCSLRALALGLIGAFVALCLVPPASAQSAQSVVESMRAQFLDQFSSVDTYVVETDLYTSYHQKTQSAPDLEFRSTTELKGQGKAMRSMGSPVQSQFDQYDLLAEHARHTGIEDVDGTRCHVLTVEDASEIGGGNAVANAETLTYYVGARDYRVYRIETVLGTTQGPAPESVTVNMRDYRTVDGLTMPWTIEVVTNQNQSMSPAQKQQIEELKKQMEQMDEEQRKMMKRMMGDRMEQLEKMMSGEPTVIQVQSVKVNTPLPSGIFN